MIKLLKRAGRGANLAVTNDEEMQHLIECKTKLNAINENQAVIEFTPTGTITTANANFEAAMGYMVSEIVGQHHRIFMDPYDASRPEYDDFWRQLGDGINQTGRFKRQRKDGSTIWLQAMYYPIVGPNGRTQKVVKFATDITDQVELEASTREAGEAVAVSISQMADTISEISSNVFQTVEEATSTEAEIADTVEFSTKLEESGKQIEKVVDIIRSLAEQTNLLALNATIESARAGEAGKGFAVVANEVKELAKATSGATEHIGTVISEIQRLVESNVDSTSKLSNRIKTVTENMQSVSAAVEQQSATMTALNETAMALKH